MDRRLNRFVIVGIMATIFISKPFQTSSQCELVITIRVPRVLVNEIVVKISRFISTGRV